ncbi:MAG TPA: exopolysaccharide biosynthesis protein [Vicinamibacteria bacterium]|nr:exopolysaccharide biosynthesis protein [Vicinamibacteria bacterium]
MRGSPGASTAGLRLADDLAHLLALADGRALPIAHVVSAMDDRGYALALLFLAFPFVLPIPSLGMSAPVGFFLALTGLALARGGTPSLPAFLQRREIAYPALKAIAAAMARARREARPGCCPARRCQASSAVAPSARSSSISLRPTASRSEANSLMRTRMVTT